MKYGPYFCIAVVLAILFVLWAFWGGKNYEFVGLAPLAPDTCGSYTGSLYNWGNITPAIGYDPIEGRGCVPRDIACQQDQVEHIPASVSPDNIVIDNTPSLPTEFQNTPIIPDNTCPNPERHNILPTNTINPPFVDVNNEPAPPLVVQSDVVIPTNNPNLPNLPIILNTKPNNIALRSLPSSVPIKPSQIAMNTYLLNPPKKKGRMISRGERMCCQTMERIYGVPFVTKHPDWLVNPETGNKLELDCYNEELRIAVEYNGEQHYMWPNFTNQTYEQFVNQVRRDQLKIDECDRHGVYLIIVPYNVQHERISEFIMSHLPETIRKRLQEENVMKNIR